MIIVRIASVLSWLLGSLLFFFHGSPMQYVAGLALCGLGYLLWLSPPDAPGSPPGRDQ